MGKKEIKTKVKMVMNSPVIKGLMWVGTLGAGMFIGGLLKDRKYDKITEACDFHIADVWLGGLKAKDFMEELECTVDVYKDVPYRVQVDVN